MSHPDKSVLSDREKYIVYLLGRYGRVSSAELCETFNMAPSSIRKILNNMEQKGMLIRTHGGAASVDFKRDDTLELKMSMNINQKKAIAAAARKLIRNGDTIALGDGSTVNELCMRIRNMQDLLIITDSITAVNILMNAPGIELRICGGIVEGRTGHIVGPSADKFFYGMKIDKAFIGADGINLVTGVDSANILLSHVERSMVYSAEKRYVMCDHSKIGRESLSQIIPLEDITALITDNGTNGDFLAALDEIGVKSIVAVV